MGRVTVEELEEFRGQASYRIETPQATYVYHREGAGFAALFDPAGADWIGHQPFGGADGRHRGIPNAIHPEGGFHPGTTRCRSALRSAGPERVVIESESRDGEWACRWEVDEERAILTLERAAHPYWLLYEGTPGGDYRPWRSFVVDSRGKRSRLGWRFERRLPDPRWVYFESPRSDRVLFLIDHTERAPGSVDSFWSMKGQMTVFGFGRTLDRERSDWQQFRELPARMSVGLLARAPHAELSDRLDALAREPLD